MPGSVKLVALAGRHPAGQRDALDEVLERHRARHGVRQALGWR
ncbi:hypothetical protein ACIBK1_14025 [Microbispora rosea]|nr:hypothetical protein [Microbispora rosea]